MLLHTGNKGFLALARTFNGIYKDVYNGRVASIQSCSLFYLGIRTTRLVLAMYARNNNKTNKTNQTNERIITVNSGISNPVCRASILNLNISSIIDTNTQPFGRQMNSFIRPIRSICPNCSLLRSLTTHGHCLFCQPIYDFYFMLGTTRHTIASHNFEDILSPCVWSARRIRNRAGTLHSFARSISRRNVLAHQPTPISWPMKYIFIIYIQMIITHSCKEMPRKKKTRARLQQSLGRSIYCAQSVLCVGNPKLFLDHLSCRSGG